jgi:uncharacterized protein (UPF0335 family)
MAKKNSPEVSVADMQPDEVNALRTIVKEFIGKIENIDNEIETLKDDRKNVIEEYSDRIDVKTLNLALKVIKIQASVQHRDSYDLFVETLTNPY